MDANGAAHRSRPPRAAPGSDDAMGRVLSACSTCSAGVSVACMGSMGAAMAATGASGVAGGAGMAAMAGSAGASAPLVSRFLSSIGLGALNHVPDAVLRPIFIALLVLSVGSAMLAYRSSRAVLPLALTVASAATLYVAIYVLMSEPLYYAGLGGMIAAGILAFLTSRPRLPHALRRWRRAQPLDVGGH